jgi:hypothetical protein
MFVHAICVYSSNTLCKMCQVLQADSGNSPDKDISTDDYAEFTANVAGISPTSLQVATFTLAGVSPISPKLSSANLLDTACQATCWKRANALSMAKQLSWSPCRLAHFVCDKE